MAGSSETGAQLFARLGSRPSLRGLCPDLFADTFPKPGDLVEICGESGTAKTELLLNFITACILPPRWKEYMIGGIGTGVVFVDTQFQFSMLRIFSLLEKRVTNSVTRHHDDDSLERGRSTSTPGPDGSGNNHEQAGGNDLEDSAPATQATPDPTEIESFIKTCLERLYLVRCNSSQQLLITLHSLETFFANRSEMSILMVDSWSSFYWMDRAGFGDQMSLVDGCQKSLTTAVEKLLNDNQVTVFVAKSISLRPGGKMENYNPQRIGSPSSSRYGDINSDKYSKLQDLGSMEWNKLVRQRFFLERDGQPTTADYRETNWRIAFTAIKLLPKPMKTEAFLVSSAGLEFNTG